MPELRLSAGGHGPWPAVLVYMDGIGIRPAMLELGERLATYGYFVLLPDLYYRSGPDAPMGAEVFADPEKRKVLMEKYFALATQANIMSDTQAFLGYLAAQSDVKPGEYRHDGLLHGWPHVPDSGRNVPGADCGGCLIPRRPARDR